jgi:hypothetical protein
MHAASVWHAIAVLLPPLLPPLLLPPLLLPPLLLPPPLLLLRVNADLYNFLLAEALTDQELYHWLHVAFCRQRPCLQTKQVVERPNSIGTDSHT